MNTHRLKIYLNDHMAAMTSEVELAQRVRGENRHGALGDFLGVLVTEIQGQQTMAQRLLADIGGSEDRLKRGTAWMAEKLGRLKFNDSLLKYSDLSRLVELEGLLLAARLRLALWDALDTVRSPEGCFCNYDFAELRIQTESHLTQLQTFHAAAARQALLAAATPCP